MILIDTGPIVALFDPADADHEHCSQVFDQVSDRVVTTLPVLTEAFHLLRAGSIGARALRDFAGRGLVIWNPTQEWLSRAFALMETYGDHQMDFADASLVAAAEALRTTTIFTLDVNDFETYRPRIGRTLSRFRIL